MDISLSGVIIYAKDVEKTAEFYTTHFGLDAHREDRLISLRKDNQEVILIHKAGAAVKLGQACIKLVFSVPDVEAFKAHALKNGLKFGATHKGNGYLFANAKDPDKNNVCISSRAYAQFNLSTSER
ncbi:VOC family protein [Vibrio mangrovi]|uniref:Glyoxalase-like domain protein n=1 Tax=Vibrio mangrovi TaxID=474394 RepID=A0A1Y6IQA1_9VIBR|nr:VOC family protein [Vibrio mangrovi]MDW6003964.1 VOC family protein [Vibrio mangrovi]SMR99241.1 Glyoxalase-like domain protein [Vibrio mangrovi]